MFICILQDRYVGVICSCQNNTSQYGLQSLCYPGGSQKMVPEKFVLNPN